MDPLVNTGGADGTPHPPSTEDTAALTRRIHEAAMKERGTHGIGLWDRFPPAIAARILRSGITVADLSINEMSDVVVMDDDGTLHRCTTSSIHVIV